METLYSRAHRIGLDGISCLLDGLRKNVSLSSLAVVVVCVFVCPVSEVVVLAEQPVKIPGWQRNPDHSRILI